MTNWENSVRKKTNGVSTYRTKELVLHIKCYKVSFVCTETATVFRPSKQLLPVRPVPFKLLVICLPDCLFYCPTQQHQTTEYDGTACSFKLCWRFLHISV